MDRNTIFRWIIDCLRSPLELNEHDKDCHMVWQFGDKPKLCIWYQIQGKTHGKFATSDTILSDAINFTNFENVPRFDSDKLARLAEQIEENLRNGGNYQIKLIGNTDFQIVRRDDGP